jgi:anti-sigma factor ChrR (cupin superfamily)
MNSPISPPVTMNPALKSHYIDTTALDWEPTKIEGITAKILFSDQSSGMSTILFKMAPGAVVPLHEHTGFEQTYMLEGSLEDHEGKAFAQHFVWRPAGNIHEAHAPNGAVFLSFFTKPNKFFSGMHFYTEEA